MSKDISKKIFLFKETLLSEGKLLYVERLRHPGTGDCGFFVLHKEKKHIYEILQFYEIYRSWFINDNISCDGKCYITVPIDIRFFVLHYLKKNCVKNALPLNQWEENKYPITVLTILEFLPKSAMEEIADVKSSGDVVGYKYNEKKALAWLIVKVEFLIETLKNNKIHMGCRAVSATFDEGEAGRKEVGLDEYIEFSCGIIGSYISSELYEKLLKFFSLKQENKRKSFQTLVDEPIRKRIKTKNIINNEEIKEKKVTSKEKSLAKAARGTNSITSFFKSN